MASIRLSQVSYGAHMATSSAIGLLFLGGGGLTLKNDREGVAALLMAFYPKYPSNALDNRFHLQVSLTRTGTAGVLPP
jgi:anaphase-promoting complex subunit 1